MSLGINAPERAFPEPVHDASVDTVACHTYRILGLLDEDDNARRCYIVAMELPPVTVFSLAPLEPKRMTENLSLRHDLNFDHDLVICADRYSADAESSQNVEEYWTALDLEIRFFTFCHEKIAQLPEYDQYYRRLLMAGQNRLPNLFMSVRAVLLGLLPHKEHQSVTYRLEPEAVTIEVLRGMCDLPELTGWIARMLRRYCAERHHVAVDLMQNHLLRGAHEDDHSLFVTGLRKLMDILEAMKIDVANNQLNYMRPVLICHTVGLERASHEHQMALGRYRNGHPKRWLQYELDMMRIPHDTEPWAGLVCGILRVLLYEDTDFPEVFFLDQERLTTLRGDMRNAIFHKICQDVYFEHVIIAPRQDAMKEAERLYLSLADIVEVNTWRKNVRLIAEETGRFILMAEGQSVAHNPDLQQSLERALYRELHIRSKEFERLAGIHFARLLPKTLSRTQEWLHYTPLEVADKALPGHGVYARPLVMERLAVGALSPHDSIFASRDPDEDVVSRIAHLSVLHWQTWGPLVYFSQDDSGEVEPHQVASGTTVPQILATVPNGLPETVSNGQDSR